MSTSSSPLSHPDLPSFFNACEGGHEATVRLLLYNEKNPVPVDCPDTYGNTPLHEAAKSGRTAIVRILLAKQAPANAINNYNETPLHAAALGGHAETVKCLLQEGHADPLAADMFGVLPIHAAAKKGHKDVVKALVTICNMDPLIQDSRGNTAQSLADDGKYFELQSYMKIAVKKWNKKKAAAAAEAEQQQQQNGGAAASTATEGTNHTTTSSTTTEVERTATTSGGITASTTLTSANLQTANATKDQKTLPTTTTAITNNSLASSGTHHHGMFSSESAAIHHHTTTNHTHSSGVNPDETRQQQPQQNNKSLPVAANSSATSSSSSFSTPASSSMGFSMMSNGSVSEESQQQLSKAVDDLYAKIRATFPPYYIFDFKDIQLEKRLGAGGGGSVFKATIKSCHRPVAAKLFREADVAVDQAIQECKIAMQLHHKNIIQFVGLTVVGNLWPLPCAEVMMLMELGEGTLQGLLSENSSSSKNHHHHHHHHKTHHSFESTFTWDKVLKYAFQIASGLDYLHNEVKCNHLDLKPANCCIDSVHTLKLIDFGLTRQLHLEQTHVDISRVNLGTSRWMAPEQAISNRVAPTNDVYSFAAIVMTMINKDGKEPWHDYDAKEIGKIISSPSFHEQSDGSENGGNCPPKGLAAQLDPREGCPEFLIDLCRRCLEIDFMKRPKHGGELVQLMKEGAKNALDQSPKFAHVAGDLTYMSLDDKSQVKSDDAILAQQGSASSYPEETQVVEGVGYDDDY